MTRVKDFTRDELNGLLAHLATPAGADAFREFILAGGLFDGYAIAWRRRRNADDPTPIPPPPIVYGMYDFESDHPRFKAIGPPIVEHAEDHGRAMRRTICVVEDWHEGPPL